MTEVKLSLDSVINVAQKLCLLRLTLLILYFVPDVIKLFFYVKIDLGLWYDCRFIVMVLCVRLTSQSG